MRRVDLYVCVCMNACMCVSVCVCVRVFVYGLSGSKFLPTCKKAFYKTESSSALRLPLRFSQQHRALEALPSLLLYYLLYCFTGFTGTKVQILTHKTCKKLSHKTESSSAVHLPLSLPCEPAPPSSALTSAVLSLLALLVHKYKY